MPQVLGLALVKQWGGEGVSQVSVYSPFVFRREKNSWLMVLAAGMGCCHPGFIVGETVSHMQPCSAVHLSGRHCLCIPLFGVFSLISHRAETLTQLPGDCNPGLTEALEGGEDL